MRIVCLVLAVALCQAVPVPEPKLQVDIDNFCKNLVSVRGNDVSKVKMLEADPQDCHNYYMCQYNADGDLLQAHYRRCQGMLRWDPAIMNCVWNLPGQEGTCGQDTCLNDDVALQGFYVSDTKENCNEYIQCANGVSVKRCCPFGQMFNILTAQCEECQECLDTGCTDGNHVPEEEEEEEEEIYEKDVVYTCEQGDYLYTLVTTKSFTRTAPDGTVESFNCYEEAPYFSIRKCTCYSKDELPPVDRTLPDGVTLADNECYKDNFIFTKLGVNRYEGRKADGVDTFLEARDCPADKLFFRLETCCCDVITLEDTLLDNQCVIGDKIYQTVDDGHYKIGSVKTRVFDLETLSCPPTMPVWNFDTCSCISVEPIAPVVRPEWMNHCGIFSMTTSRLGDKWVTRHGSVDVSNNEACFAGTADSYFDIPYYTANDLGNKLSIAFKFKYNVFATHPAISLLNNGVDEDDQSVDISVDDSHVNVSLALKGQSEKCVIEMENLHIIPRIFPAPPPEYDEIAMIFDGTKSSGNLQLRVKSQNMDSVMASVDCPGTLKTTTNPVTLGANFPGCVDELYICKTLIDPLDQAMSIGK